MIRGYYFGEVKNGTNIKSIHDNLNGYVYNPISQNI